MSENTLVNLARSGDKQALNELMQRFKPLVKTRAKDYHLAGGDLEDLLQEGMIGLYKAVLDFDESKNPSFAAFASLCVVRQIQTAIKAAARQKHLPLNTSVSLHSEIPTHDTESEQGQETYLDKLQDNKTPSPEAVFLGQEAFQDINNFIQSNLTALEQQVIIQQLAGKTHAEIAAVLGKNTKSIDNTIQRIRKKIGSIIS